MTKKPDSKNDEDLQILMCVRVEQMSTLYGSVRAECVNCRSAVWVSVSGQKALQKDLKLQIYCVKCATKQMQQSDDETKVDVVPGAVEEMLRHFRKAGQN